MGLEKVVVSQVVKVAKDTGRLENTIDTMKDKLMEEGMKVVESAGINPNDLPFNIQDVLSGNIENPESLLTPEVICSLPPLTAKQKKDGAKQVESTLSALNGVISSKNQLSSALSSVQGPLNALTTTGSTLSTIIGTVKNAIKIIKAIPVPTAIIPPFGGIGVPINVLTILSDSLDQLDKLLTYGKGVTEAIPKLVGGVSGMINTTITGLNSLDGSIQPVVTTLTMVKAVVEKSDLCPALSTDEVNSVKTEVNNAVQESLTVSGVNSNPSLNAIDETQLLGALAPNAAPGLIYKQYRLILQYDPDNEYSFPRRRIRAFRNFEQTNPGMEVFLTNLSRTKISQSTLYNSPKSMTASDYSYSATVEVLYEEMKYKIDTFLLSLRFGLAADDAFARGDFSADQDEAADALGLTYQINGESTLFPDDDYSYNAYNHSTEDYDVDENNETSGQIIVYNPVKVVFTVQAGEPNTFVIRGVMEITKQSTGERVFYRNIYHGGTSIESNFQAEIDLTDTGVYDYTLKIPYNHHDYEKGDITQQKIFFTVTPI